MQNEFYTAISTNIFWERKYKNKLRLLNICLSVTITIILMELLHYWLGQYFPYFVSFVCFFYWPGKKTTLSHWVVHKHVYPYNKSASSTQHNTLYALSSHLSTYTTENVKLHCHTKIYIFAREKHTFTFSLHSYTHRSEHPLHMTIHYMHSCNSFHLCPTQNLSEQVYASYYHILLHYYNTGHKKTQRLGLVKVQPVMAYHCLLWIYQSFLTWPWNYAWLLLNMQIEYWTPFM